MKPNALFFSLCATLTLSACAAPAASSGAPAAAASALPGSTLQQVSAPAATPTPKIRQLTAIGASDVVGLGATHPEQEGWAPVLATLLPGPPALSKLGYAGELASQLRKGEVAQAAKTTPDAIVLWTGINDFNSGVPLEGFSADLDAILETLAGTGAELYVINLPDLSGLPALKTAGPAIKSRLPGWQAAVERAAAQHGASVIDLADYSREIAAHPEYISADGFHPSTLGYRRLAGIVAQAISQ